MQPRAFNEIRINYTEGFLTKASSQLMKIKDEVNYYLALPVSIAKFFPKLLNYNKEYHSYNMEYIPFPTLSEILVNEKLNIKEENFIVEKIFQILDKIHCVKPVQNNISQEDILKFYIEKTLSRIDELKTNKDFNHLINPDYIIINEKKYKTFKSLEDNFISHMTKYTAAHSSITAIHGDYCFSNILYCPKTKHIKLIDPRGSFVRKGIYGDPYYDYAKILHCIHGRYDYIVHDKYNFKQNAVNNFTLQTPASPLLSFFHKYYIKILKSRNINLEFIYLIEASLFLSMASLHYENLARQKALFLTGLIILNNFFEGQNENLY